MKEEFSLKDLTERLKEVSRRVDESREITKRTGRITPDDLVGLTEIRAYDFYDPQEEKPMTSTDPKDALGRHVTMEEAVALLEKFEADRHHLQRAVMRAIDLPHWSRVKAAMHQDKQRDIARRFPKP